MPFPPPTPNELTTSAFPSPVVSRNSRTPPRGPDTATSRSPFSRTTMWRDGPIDSATTSAQKPGCKVSPALSGAQTGFRTCGVEATSNAARAATRRRDIREQNIQLSRSRQPSFPLSRMERGPGGEDQGVRMPSLNTLLLVLQAATLPALKQEAVHDVGARAQFTQ